MHGTYDGSTQLASIIELIDNVATYKYQCKLMMDKTNGAIYLRGSWNSLIDGDLFGELLMTLEADVLFNSMSGIWVGEAQPAEELADFFIPINPIRWCATLFRKDNDTWQMFGSGYFNDSTDIPNQSILFFSINGTGTLDDMKIIKKYLNMDHSVEYRGKLIEYDNGSYSYVGHWSNVVAGSYGSFLAAQYCLNPMISYRLDICLCEICTNILHTGDNRWFCSQCHLTTCPGCNHHKLAIDHPHKLMPHILPTQQIAQGKSCRELITSAFHTFQSLPLIVFRSTESKELVWFTYGEMSMKCNALVKYWKSFVINADDQVRSFILIMADTSPAYIACLLAGLMCQAVLVPIHGALKIDALTHLLSTIDPSIVVVGEPYLNKLLSVLSENSSRLLMTISQNEEQFQRVESINERSISLTTVIEKGNKIPNEYHSHSSLSRNTMSAILSTSGSTGFPKGAIFTEDLLVPNDTFTIISPFIRIDYQPFDPVLVLSLMSTIRYGSCRGLTNLKDMWNDIKDIRPTSLGLSPAIWTVLYKTYMTKLAGLSTEEQRQNVAKEMREILGGRVIVGTTGGGSISASVLSFVRDILKINVADMYGCRECGMISRNGIIYPDVEVKLLAVPDMKLDGIEEGEVCVHSPRMITGYWGIEKHPSFIKIDGKAYYKTGDIGQVHQRTLKLLDRSGTIIKNSLGEWISPVKIENILEQLPEISLAFILGDASYSYLSVIVCPSQSGSTLNEMEMLQLIRFYGVHCGLHGSEIPQSIYIERDIIWNETNSLMKEKKCRSALLKHYTEVKMHLFNQELISDNKTNIDLSPEFVAILENVLSRSLNGQISGANTFSEIGGNSFAVNLLCKIFNEHGIFLDPSIAYSHQLNHLDEILSKKRIVYHQINNDIDWKKEYKLPEDMIKLISKSISSRKKNILVTGSTGFLGPLLVYEIAERTDHDVLIYCLIRATNAEHAQQRLKQDFDKCNRSSSIDWTRIRCIVGDVSKKNLGLTFDLYNELVEQIGIIYHNATVVHMRMPYKTLKQWNVEGTLNCLKLALTSYARFIYTSSTAALPPLGGSTEDFDGWIKLTPNEINLKDGYGQTKAVVERLLFAASRLGADIVVIRPCTISADTQTGYSNLSDFINLVLLAELEMGTIVENANMLLHFIPVDYCAKAMVALAMHPGSGGKCFNFYGNELNITVLHQLLVDRFPNVIQKKILQDSWKEFVLNNLCENSRTWSLRENIASMVFIGEDRRPRKLSIQTDMTQEFLKNECGLEPFMMTKENLINLLLTKAGIEEELNGCEQSIITCKEALRIWKNEYEPLLTNNPNYLLDTSHSRFGKYLSGGNRPSNRSQNPSINFETDGEQTLNSQQGTLKVEDGIKNLFLFGFRPFSSLCNDENSIRNNRSSTQFFSIQPIYFSLIQIFEHLVRYYIKLDKIDEGERCLKEISSLSPLCHQMFYMRGLINDARGQLKLAKLNYNDALAINPYHFPTLIQLTKLLIQIGNYSLAEKYARDAISIQPSNYQPWYLLSLSMEARGEYEQSVDVGATAVHLEGDSPIVSYHSIIRVL
ncbi:unnamed protein product [Rotaria sp. Silwood1]|nr:unnamed protein product [Rotaria sp. Silwood1]